MEGLFAYWPVAVSLVATFANNANGLKPFLAGGVTQINT